MATDGRQDGDIDLSPVRVGVQSTHLASLSAGSEGHEVLEDTELVISELESSPKHSQSTRLRRRAARVSYVEAPINDASDSEDIEDKATASDSYTSPASDNESESMDAAESSEATTLTDEEAVDNAFTRPRKRKSTTSRKACGKPKPGKGVDLSLPPLDNVEDIFGDMASQALHLGLGEALENVRRPLNVATMLSGTESPLIALDLLSKALEKKGRPSIRVNHHFSAEIDVVKQGYIERNFRPKKLFRDVREFIPDDAKTAMTAYGAEESIPGELDILIAGFVCKDLSRLNNHQKGLDDEGQSGDTWRAIYSYSKRFRPSVVLIENVQNTIKFWDSFESKWAAIGYEYAWMTCDTKNYYIPQTRNRMYMVAIERFLFGENVDGAVAQWKHTMRKLQRQCSSPFDAFIANDNSDQYEYSSLASEPHWARCKLRYDQIRSEQRLGTRRPVTRWSENGTVRPPDFANRKFYLSQSSRVYDCIDVAHLQGVQKGFDSLHKMAIWDVSQNVVSQPQGRIAEHLLTYSPQDRFMANKANFGIVSCITPKGCNFVSNKQTALTGSQLLLLQGMPYDKLLFANETQKDRQDLAGNAMTTTVIGASIVSALISGSKAFRRVTPPESPDSNTVDRRKVALIEAKGMQKQVQPPPDVPSIDIGELIEDAKLSSRLCNCEGTRQLSKAVVRICSQCGHTACSDCAGNPSHNYGTTITPSQRKQTPGDFERKWWPHFPARLKFSDFPGARKLKTYLKPSGGNAWEAFVNRFDDSDIQSQFFSIYEFKRLDKCWKVSYASPEAILELLVADQIQWRLYLLCPASEPGNSPLRKALSQPLARGFVQSNILNPVWQLYIPQASLSTLQLSGSPERTNSWRSRLGLPEYKAETVPLHLQVKGDSDQSNKLTGRYSLLPHCGTAACSLYKADKANGSALYLFLEQDPIGPSHEDSFTFSYNCRRLSYGEARSIEARIDPSWRPWNMTSGAACNVKATIPGFWASDKVTLVEADLRIKVRIPSESALSASSESWGGDCSRAVTILDIKAKELLNTENLSQYAWVLGRAKTLPSFTEWQYINVNRPQGCGCSPTYPRILWSVDDDGAATAHEDRQAAALFERTLKTRCPIFHISPSSSSTTKTRIQVGVNISSLMHRARNRLTTTAHTSAWRLVTNHGASAPIRFPQLHLQSNTSDTPYAGPLRLKYELGEAQERALTWMRAQESGNELKLVEVEEAIHLELGWRAEAKAEAVVNVRGGVLADLPSFGKTVTTIALINSEFTQHMPETILKQNRTESTPSLIDLAATLIVCPPHIAPQWRTELENCLGANQYNIYNVLLLERFSDLQSLTMEEFRKARVIIVSWSVFADEEYISQLASFSAMPLPAVTKGRAFNAWLDYMSQHMPDRMQAFLSLSTSDFGTTTRKLLGERLAHPDFRATVPLKVERGSAYQSFNAINALKRSESKKASQVKRKSSPTNSRAPGSVPLFQMFHFNRIVVDEYHYLHDSKNSENYTACAAIKRISAPKRWIISGTPALANFSDVNQIASFLGVKLGRDVYGDGTAESEKKHMAEQTDVEKFLSRTETMSHYWHKARHERAQDFLDRFVRRNEPSLQHIHCSEVLRPIDLGVAHHVVYLELSQYLISQRMQIKRPRNKPGSDRVERLNASLSNSATAEEALLKNTLFHRTVSGKSGLEALIETRQEQRESTQADLLTIAKDLKEKCLERLNDTAEDYYLSFKRDMDSGNMLGDEVARQCVRTLLAHAEEASTSTKRTSKRVTSQKELTQLKDLASELRSTAQDLTLMVRAERFVASIKPLLPFLIQGGQDAQQHTCDSSGCPGTADFSQLFLIPHCGHTACQACVQARADTEACVHMGCEVPVQSSNLIKVSNLQSSKEKLSKSFGKKLDAVCRLIKTTPRGDQCLVFVPNDEAVGSVEEVFNSQYISYHSVGKGRSAAKLIEDFRTNKDPTSRKKVLILDLASESAAGA